ncbi:MAG: aminotransferase class I/II-fold pyridoxal phosphate-dependent enzyme [Acidobacteriota bacterium]
MAAAVGELLGARRAVPIVAGEAAQTSAVMSQLKRAIRGIYSNPPSHGASVAALVLGDAELREGWRAELAAIRRRIQAMRRLFADRLTDRGVSLSEVGNDFIVEQNGMFSFSGLTAPRVRRLRDEYGVYMLDSGRLNVAGITESNVDYLVDAVAAVV